MMPFRATLSSTGSGRRCNRMNRTEQGWAAGRDPGIRGKPHGHLIWLACVIVAFWGFGVLCYFLGSSNLESVLELRGSPTLGDPLATSHREFNCSLPGLMGRSNLRQSVVGTSCGHSPFLLSELVRLVRRRGPVAAPKDTPVFLGNPRSCIEGLPQISSATPSPRLRLHHILPGVPVPDSPPTRLLLIPPSNSVQISPSLTMSPTWPSHAE